MKKLIISCGGTGGHFYPGLAIGRKGKDLGVDVRLFLTGWRAEGQMKIAANFGLESDRARSLQLPRGLKTLLLFLLLFPIDFFKSLSYLKKHKPDAILLMGSFAGLPLGLAARFLGLAIYVHEGNVLAGKANRFFSKFSRKCFASFPLANESTIACPIELSGMPIRPELLKADTSFPDFVDTIDKSKSFILCFGGSQGAQAINEAFPAACQLLKAKGQDIQVVHLSGQEDNQALSASYGDVPHWIAKSSEEMAPLLACSSLVVCRGGASSLAELAYFDKQAVIIPYPYAAEDHQKVNAQLAAEYGAVLLDQKDLSADSLATSLEKLLKSKGEKRLKSLAVDDSAGLVIKGIFPSL